LIFEKANHLDKEDPLHKFQNYFLKPKNLVYLDGNSLGLLPKNTKNILDDVVNIEWGHDLIGSWNSKWLPLNDRVEKKLAKIINAQAGEVFVGDSTSINLYKITKALVYSKLYSNNLISDTLNFPSDRYILSGIAGYDPGIHYHEIDYQDNVEAEVEEIESKIRSCAGVYCLSLSTYLSAYLYPIKHLNQFAKKHGSVIVWDLSHAIGSIEIDVNEQEILAAVGCTYKHLNGGPGSPGFLYVDKELNDSLATPIQGWFGHKHTFKFSDSYQKGIGSNQYKVGTPNILSLAALEPGLDITLEASISSIRKKCLIMGDFIQEYLSKELSDLGVQIVGPLSAEKRGGHITIKHQESWRICKCLQMNEKTKIVTDFRPNSLLRIALTPLYTSYGELALFLTKLKQILESKKYLKLDDSKPVVT
jgi:kynureninase